MPPSERMLTREEVAAHNTDGDMWLIIDGDVWDVSKFGALHPGGLPPLREVAGGDATKVRPWRKAACPPSTRA